MLSTKAGDWFSAGWRYKDGIIVNDCNSASRDAATPGSRAWRLMLAGRGKGGGGGMLVEHLCAGGGATRFTNNGCICFTAILDESWPGRGAHVEIGPTTAPSSAMTSNK